MTKNTTQKLGSSKKKSGVTQTKIFCNNRLCKGFKIEVGKNADFPRCPFCNQLSLYVKTVEVK